MTRSSPLALALVIASGCGSLGNSGEFSEQILKGGTGPFRLATEEETGVDSAPDGALFRATADAIGRTYAEPGFAIYDVATPLAAPPARDPSVPAFEVDPAQFEPRRIARATTHREVDGITRLGFEPGADLLVPTEPWEAGGVYDPAVLHLPDGSVRLYYATNAGLGVAGAPSIDGTFTRLVGAPILGDVDGRGPARAPSVALLPSGEFLLYAEVAGAIHVARSVDGLAFTLVDPNPSTPAIEPLDLSPPPATDDAGTPLDDAGAPITETSLRAPSVVVAYSSLGRLLVRLYLEARASDGTTTLRIAGSYDGLTFERSSIVCYRRGNPTSPSAFLGDDGITRLTFVQLRTSVTPRASSAVLASAPAALPLPLP